MEQNLLQIVTVSVWVMECVAASRVGLGKLKVTQLLLNDLGQVLLVQLCSICTVCEPQPHTSLCLIEEGFFICIAMYF